MIVLLSVGQHRSRIGIATRDLLGSDLADALPGRRCAVEVPMLSRAVAVAMGVDRRRRFGRRCRGRRRRRPRQLWRLE